VQKEDRRKWWFLRDLVERGHGEGSGIIKRVKRGKYPRWRGYIGSKRAWAVEDVLKWERETLGGLASEEGQDAA
jgi:hypothetical protein